MKFSELLIGMAVGAGLMYLFDPRAGNGRRGPLRDQLAEAKESVFDKPEDARHLFNEMIADNVLRDRVRAALERRISYAKAFHVEVAGGCAILRGPILSDDLLPALSAARAVRGITSVDSQLDVHDTPANTSE